MLPGARHVATALPGSVYAGTIYGMGMVGADADFHTAAPGRMAAQDTLNTALFPNQG